jgi:phosphate uptake regulator
MTEMSSKETARKIKRIGILCRELASDLRSLVPWIDEIPNKISDEKNNQSGNLKKEVVE